MLKITNKDGKHVMTHDDKGNVHVVAPSTKTQGGKKSDAPTTKTKPVRRKQQS